MFEVESPAIPDTKEPETFRIYEDAEDRVTHHYRMMRTNQTVDYVRRMREKFSKFDIGSMDIWEAFEVLGDFVDASDPDTTLPNLVHMFQVRKKQPLKS